MVGIGRQQIEFGEDAAHVLLHRAVTYDKRRGDCTVGATLGHQAENLSLPRGELVKWMRTPAPCKQLRDDLRVENRAPRSDAAQRVDELDDVSDPVLQQVTDSSGLPRQ